MSDKNVKVFCRFRPINQQEQEQGSKRMIRIDNNKKVYVQSENKIESNYNFDHIFHDQSTQEEVYNIVGKPLIAEIFKGYNATVFAYGQTSSGKTLTLSGYSHVVDNADLLSREEVVLWRNPKDMGIVPRMVKDIFETMKERKDHEFSVQMSFIEIYLEKIRDLLSPSKENLEIRESRFKGLWIEDVTEIYVSSFEETIKLIRKGELNRTVASTAMNVHSSRSHSVLILSIQQNNRKTQAKTTSKIVCVDLAGSEKIEKTKAEGIILKQAQATNKSLLTLGLVIRALVDKKPHIPYRDSKLTRLLTDSLGGNSKTHLIVTCSPASYNIEETISTLRFGNITQQIKNKPRVNLEINIEEYKKLLLAANEKIATQEMIILALQADLNKLLTLCESKKIDIAQYKKEYNFDFKNTEKSYEDSMEEVQRLTEELGTKSTLISELQKTIETLRGATEKSKDLTEVLRDDLDHRRQEVITKTTELEEFRSRNDDLIKMYDALQKNVTEQTEKYRSEQKVSAQEIQLLNNESTQQKQRISSLLEETLSLKETIAKGGFGPSLGLNELQLTEKLLLVERSEEELKLLLDGKIKHVSVLEESLRIGNTKVQELASDHKKRCIEYEKRIKDLESQLRILRNTSPPNNIIVPLKY
jgi:kinesin family protein 5